ncbi:HD domain-containing protein [Thermosulfurimonas dismutans]|uniref:Metal dependent phosphohydrolase n=1 Tax=Thermosulfurimonas dismutans TaxID=999894 RepID=A0A179D4B1_9BACT|nr:HD domain-containing protein [Thermosulfurimonas dismutans]OAQ20813.1 metal dependent phosphohydrolase [Thermosulfurimonas dismutans]
MSRIPSLEECYRLLEKEGVPFHIRRHAEKVALVAVFLGKELIKRGEKLNLKLLCAGGLLHDLTKHHSLKTGENHAESARNLLLRLGYPEVAKVVEQHIFLKPGPPGTPIREEELVYYADKRVKHEEIVSLKERFIDLRERYGRRPSSWVRIFCLEELTKLLEKRLFKRLPFGPDKILELNQIEEIPKCLTVWLCSAGETPRNGRSL